MLELQEDMLKRSFSALIFFLFALSATAFAEGYKPAPAERAPKDPVKCEWSKLSSTQYSECQKRREYYDSLSAKEKAKQDREAAKALHGQGAATATDDGGVVRRAREHKGRR